MCWRKLILFFSHFLKVAHSTWNSWWSSDNEIAFAKKVLRRFRRLIFVWTVLMCDNSRPDVLNFFPQISQLNVVRSFSGRGEIECFMRATAAWFGTRQVPLVFTQKFCMWY